MLTLEYFDWDIFLLTMQLGDFFRFAYARINHIKCAQLCQRQESTSPATTSAQLSLPHSAAVSALELPKQALDQARQVNQLLADVGTNETQIEASSRNPEILPCVPELKKLKKCAFSSKRQCSLPGIDRKSVV